MTTQEKNRLAERLRTAREDAGLSQHQVAKKVKVSQPRISAWEHGQAVPDTEQLLELAVALNVSVIDLLGLEVTR